MRIGRDDRARMDREASDFGACRAASAAARTPGKGAVPPRPAAQMSFAHALNGAAQPDSAMTQAVQASLTVPQEQRLSPQTAPQTLPHAQSTRSS